ncbi:MAG TPA: patatin-like protein [Candidatus Limnocylindrales bacterium]|nr:patatin-like protein [Candidatus Limnocylindrales bacterium]
MGFQIKQPTPDREVRLGIVLYGGVSLAIYENGVAQELFRAVKGEGVYSFIKQLIGSDIVVDIVSGTSAGGINGIMLGYALANDRDFKSSAKLWREDGDILRLLNDASAKNATSLLDSRGYYQERLQAAFEGMPVYLTPGNDGVDASCRVKSDIAEFDLFVTGTDVQGCVFTVFDDRGQPIDVKTHRQMFQLSYRQERKNDFKPAESASLAKLARITSCFPVAFEPVQVQPNKEQDAMLKRWGKLDTRDSMFFLDGGVLDNKPFSYTIDTIMRRTADRDVDRMLLYVEPDPERFTQTDLSETPNILQAGTAALISIPGYQSIAGDLQNIAAHNDRVNALTQLLQPLVGAEEGGGHFASPDADGGLRLIGDQERRDLYRASRLVQLRDRAVNGMLNSAEGRVYMRSKEQRHAAKLLVEAFEKWEGDGTDTLGDFDVYFRMRRLLHMAYFIMGQAYPSGDQQRADKPQYLDLWRRLNHQFKLLEITQFAMERAVDETRFEWAKVMSQGGDVSGLWEQAKAVLFAVLDTSDFELNAGMVNPGNPGAEKEERQRLANRLSKKLQALTAAPPPVGNLLRLCDSQEWSILQRFASAPGMDAAAREYARFAIIDSFRFPLQRAAGTDSMDAIRTVRISPIDAKRAYSALTLNEKLCGNELGHFGGFLKRSWRANDTMWGRLDAVCQLVECLVTSDRIDKMPPAALAMARNFPLDSLFPNASSILKTEIGDALDEIIRLQGDKTDPNPRFERFWNALTRAAQAEILNDEVPRVVDAAIRQQADWNQFPMTARKAELLSKQTVWTVGRRRLDSALAAYASSRLTEAMEKPGEWPTYFESIYAVGSEAWNNDIPKPILLEIGTGAGLVLKNCLMSVAGKHATRLQKFVLNGVYFPLVVTNRLVRIQRTMPEYTWVTLVTVFTLSVALLALDVFRGMVFGKDVPWPKWPWIAGPAVAASICVLLILLMRVPVREINHPHDIRTALAGYADSAGCQYCLVLNTPLWVKRYPGDQPDGGTPAAPPDPVVGPVENFYAQEDIPSQLQSEALSLFGAAVAQNNVKGVQVRVETIRKIGGKDMTSWILKQPARQVVFDSYEGVISLIVRLKEALKEEQLPQLKEDLTSNGFWLAAYDGDQKQLKVVAREPRVFACRVVCKSGNSVACRSQRCTFTAT